MRYPAKLQTADVDVVLCDLRPTNTGQELKAAEALIRRIWTDRPGARIISPIFPARDTGATTVNELEDYEIAANTLCQHYGVIQIDYRQAVIDLVDDGADLNTYMADEIHPTTAGQQLCFEMIRDYLIANPDIIHEAEDHNTLPARLYDDGGFEREPARIVGTDNDSTTGTWSTTGTRIESSTAGSTVTFTATCQSFGIYRSDSGYVTATVDVQIDGGAWQLARAISHNGFYGTNPEYGEHTITIRVRTGSTVRIDEFWAI